MPTIGKLTSEVRGATALEDIAERLSDLIEAKQQGAAKGPSEHGWLFTVHRDGDGFIQTITATPK